MSSDSNIIGINAPGFGGARRRAQRTAEERTLLAVMQDVPHRQFDALVRGMIAQAWQALRDDLTAAERRNLPRVERAARSGLGEEHALAWSALEGELRVLQWVRGTFDDRRERHAAA